MIKYVFKEDAVLAFPNSDKADPQKIGEALAKIEKDSGSLKPQLIVDAAKATRHPLHKYFEWDDVKAANAHRLSQARAIVQVIDIVENKFGRPSISAFISITNNKGTNYHTVGSVLQSADLQRIVLQQLDRELAGIEKRAAELNDVCELIRNARELVKGRIVATETRV